MSFSEIDYWRLNENLSVTEAAMLAAGIDPGVWESTSKARPDDGQFHKRGESNHVNNYIQSPKFIAVFGALRE